VCTLTWHRTGGGYHLFVNRDERRERRPAQPPRALRAGALAALAPADGDHGGTWIAVNARGVSASLLNGPPPELPHGSDTATYVTRGQVPLRLVAAESAATARALLSGLDLGAFRPFVVAVLDPREMFVAHWTGAELTLDAAPPRPPLVSSSFATAAVRAERTALFARLVPDGAEGDPVERHLAFHRSHDPRPGPCSPCMHRPDARTVSRSWIDVGPTEIRFRYVDGPPCLAAVEPAPVRLSRARD